MFPVGAAAEEPLATDTNSPTDIYMAMAETCQATELAAVGHTQHRLARTGRNFRVRNLGE